MSEWIDVNDRLPEIEKEEKHGDHKIKKSVRVLCACKQKSGKVLVKEGYYHQWDWSENPHWRIPGNIDSVTHWMPLPEPPMANKRTILRSERMTKRKCLREHYIPYIETYCQVGRMFWRFDYCTTVHYCHFCNKIRVQRKLYFNIPKIFKKKDSEIPF